MPSNGVTKKLGLRAAEPPPLSTVAFAFPPTMAIFFKPCSCVIGRQNTAEWQGTIRDVRETNLGLQRKEGALVLQQNDGLARDLGHDLSTTLPVSGLLHEISVEHVGGSRRTLLHELQHLGGALLDGSLGDLPALDAAHGLRISSRGGVRTGAPTSGS